MWCQIGVGYGRRNVKPGEERPAIVAATCPLCRQGSLRMITTITQVEVLCKILHHLKLAADLPPMAPARARQATFDWVAHAHAIARGLRSDVRAAEGCLTPLRVCNRVPRPSRGLPPRTPLRRYPARS
jgi:hypothetical protein